MMAARGFPPVSRRDASILILGSLPGQRSIDAGQYYAHPRNAFWRIVEDLFDVPAKLAYGERTAELCNRGVALWDVLQSSRRPGSLDSAIVVNSAQINDFNKFFSSHPKLKLVCFNGSTAARLFMRMVLPTLAKHPPTLCLPSTSAAYAAMPYEQKRHHWRRILAAAER
jgi:hypoxanthine-DNA glycosylase